MTRPTTENPKFLENAAAAAHSQISSTRDYKMTAPPPLGAPSTPFEEKLVKYLNRAGFIGKDCDMALRFYRANEAECNRKDSAMRWILNGMQTGWIAERVELDDAVETVVQDWGDKECSNRELGIRAAEAVAKFGIKWLVSDKVLHIMWEVKGVKRSDPLPYSDFQFREKAIQAWKAAKRRNHEVQTEQKES